MQWIREQERPLRFLANRFLLVMRKYPNLTAEAAFFRTLEHYGIELTDEEFVEKMYAVRRVIYGAIQLEFSYTPLYASYYIEGINHLYEFDVGPESGWMCLATAGRTARFGNIPI